MARLAAHCVTFPVPAQEAGERPEVLPAVLEAIAEVTSLLAPGDSTRWAQRPGPWQQWPDSFAHAPPRWRESRTASSSSERRKAPAVTFATR